jgi:hypothetical protein
LSKRNSVHAHLHSLAHTFNHQIVGIYANVEVLAGGHMNVPHTTLQQYM